MANNRDDFTKETVRTLQERVGNRCSNPRCCCTTSGPNHTPEKATRIGVAAHITAASPGGPRFDPELTATQRSSIQNAIWLCQNCAKLVDSDPKIYPDTVLLEWRRNAEERARSEMKGGNTSALYPLNERDGWVCPHCGTVVDDGRMVCLGCQSEVVYGSTRLERENAAKAGLFVGGGLAGALVYILPSWIASSTSWMIKPGLGLGFYSAVPIAALALFGCYLLICLDDLHRRQNPPRFFRVSIT